MSTESMAIALHHSRATGTAKLILLGIANHDGDGGAWPSVATLARYGNCSVRNTQRAIAKLEELGEIRVHVQQGGNARTPDHVKPNLYEFVLTCSPDCDRTKNHRSRYELPDPLTPASPHDVGVTPPPDASVTPPLTPASPEPSKNQPKKVITSQGDQQSAREVQPAPTYPKFIPDPPRQPVRPRSEAEAAEVARLEAEPCPAAQRFTHWFPGDLTECARGCNTALTINEGVTE